MVGQHDTSSSWIGVEKFLVVTNAAFMCSPVPILKSSLETTVDVLLTGVDAVKMGGHDEITLRGVPCNNGTRLSHTWSRDIHPKDI
jgi:hypothetical protein